MKSSKSRSCASCRVLRVCAAAIVFQSLCGACDFRALTASAADQSVEDRFLKEAPTKWLEYRQIVARHTEGRAKSSWEFTSGRKYVGDASFALNIEGKAARVKFVRFEKGQAKTVEALNPEYRFRLAPGNGGQWIIQQIRTGARTIPADLIGRHFKFPLRGEEGTFADAIGCACLGQTFNAEWFPRLLDSSDFRVVRATDVKGERGLVKVEFKFQPAGPTGGGPDLRSGTIVLDAKRYWLVREVDAQAAFMAGSEKRGLVPLKGTLTIRNKIVDGKMPVPYVSHQVITTAGAEDAEGKPTPWKTILVTDVEMHDAPKIDSRQFRLSAYGLPEPAAK